MMYFQFVFAAITVIILAGSLLGRMNFKAWVLFCPLWMTLVYTVGASASGAAVGWHRWARWISPAAMSSIWRRRHRLFVAAAIIGPRMQADRDHFPPNSLLMTLAGAGILWLGWNGFNGGDPYFANADASAAIINTNIASCVGVVVWTMMDSMKYGKLRCWAR